MPTFQTSRGRYSLSIAASPEPAADSLVITLALEAASGIERFAFQCVLPAEPIADSVQSAMLETLTPIVARDFEVIREAALKSIRADHKLYRLVLSQTPPRQPK
jgi:hypothetical protein